MKLNICIIGGASRAWAIILFKDLAAAADLSGTVTLYDIDQSGAEKNSSPGNTGFFRLSETQPAREDCFAPREAFPYSGITRGSLKRSAHRPG